MFCRPGARLPSSRTFAQECGISRTTVRNVFEQLVAEGYLVGMVGSGTRVNDAIPDATASRQAGSSKERSKCSSSATVPQETNNYFGRASENPIHLGQELPFEPCLPDLNAFPFKIWHRLLAKHGRSLNRELVGYGDPAGYRPLRVAISDYLQTARAVHCHPDRVILLPNWLSGISLAAQVLLDRDDVVWIEEPGFPAVDVAFRGLGSSVVPVPLDEEGIHVESGIAAASNARMVYVHPSHQFPLGVTMSLPRRLELLAWASQNNVWVMEDDFGCEYRYSGRPFPSLQGLSEDGRVIYVGTFNTVLFTACRIAYLVVPDSLVDPFLRTLQTMGHHTASIEQAALADFLADGHFTRHIRRMRILYGDRQQALIALIKEHLKGVIDVDPDETGMHLVGWMQTRAEDTRISSLAQKAGIHLDPISHFYPSLGDKFGLLFGYTGFSVPELEEGILRLAKALSP